MNSINEEKKALRRFGGMMGGVFLFLAILFLFRKKKELLLLWGTASVLLLFLTAVAPSFLRPFHRAWMKLGNILHQINSRLILGLIYFLMITPMGLLRRLLKKKSQFLFQREAPTYWIRKKPVDFHENMRHLF